jgi:hypothetical protein
MLARNDVGVFDTRLTADQIKRLKDDLCAKVPLI